MSTRHTLPQKDNRVTRNHSPVHLLDTPSVAETISRLLDEGLKLAMDQTVSPAEPLALYRNITRKAQAEDEQSCIKEAVDALNRSAFTGRRGKGLR